MSSDDIKTTLTELHRELERTPDLDEDLRRLLVEVDADIHSVLSARERTESEVESLRGRLEALSADFAAARVLMSAASNWPPRAFSSASSRAQGSAC